jgi:hypothetical protein
MKNDWIKLEWENLWILFWVTWEGVFSTRGVIICKIDDNSIPKQYISSKIYEKFLNKKSWGVLPYEIIQEILVNGNSVWKNKNCFDLHEMWINPRGQEFFWRGNISIEIIDTVKGVRSIVDKILKKNIGLKEIRE